VYIFYQKPLLYIVDASFNSGIFPDKMKIAKVRPFFKKGIDKMSKITDKYPFYWVFPQNIRRADL